MTDEDLEDELTTLHCAAHDALGKLLQAQGYSCAPHWLCCSSEAKAKGLGFLYGQMLDCGVAFAEIEPAIERKLSSSPLYLDWKAREIAAAKSRNLDIPIMRDWPDSASDGYSSNGRGHRPGDEPFPTG